MITIKELKGFDALCTIFPLVGLLDPDLKEERFKTVLQHMIQDGYRCIAAYDAAGKMVGISAFWFAWRFWCGKYVDIDNVVIATDMRGQGVGQKMIGWIEAEAHKEGCDMALLKVYRSNVAAKRFYARHDYMLQGDIMLKPICLQKETWDAMLAERGIEIAEAVS